jgi:hypothetical protein
LKQAGNEISHFISTVFNEDGTHKTDIPYLAIAGNNNTNCKFCEFKDDEHLCNKKERIS